MLEPPGRRTLLGVGDPRAVRRILAEEAERLGPVALATLPRLGVGPAVRGAPAQEGPPLAADQDVPRVVRDALGVTPATAWDRLVTRTAPDGPADGGAAVDRLDPAQDAAAIRACLAEANPGSSADPAHPGEAAWFGVRTAGGSLAGVIGAARRRGDPGGSDLSWHLHGLGVRPGHRAQGIGAALTAAATTSGLTAGADWVSLGMYADNAPARRLYGRLGFETEARFTTYRPPPA